VYGRDRLPTNLGIDEKLLEQAVRAGGHRTKRETVNEALREYVQRRSRRGFARLFGTVEFRPDWDYKKARRR
jgi:Arc/MetJ family transcription regulator